MTDMDNMVELITHYRAYARENIGCSVEEFCAAYLETHSHKHQSAASDQEEPRQMNQIVSMQLGRLFGKLWRYVSIYSKKAFEHQDLRNFDEWLYLKVTMMMGNPRKSDVIQQLLSEFPTGIEIINRLVHNGYMTEMPDAQDKRSKRLQVTDKGQTVAQQADIAVFSMVTIVFDYLSDSEKQSLQRILQKLETFHDGHYIHTKSMDFEGLHGFVKGIIEQK